MGLSRNQGYASWENSLARVRVSSAKAKGKRVGAKGYSVDVKGYVVDAKGYVVDVVRQDESVRRIFLNPTNHAAISTEYSLTQPITHLSSEAADWVWAAEQALQVEETPVDAQHIPGVRKPITGGEAVYTQRENQSQEGRQYIPTRPPPWSSPWTVLASASSLSGHDFSDNQNPVGRLEGGSMPLGGSEGEPQHPRKVALEYRT
eukprot:1178363-Prorocentrum_minimum.AAC.1